MTGMAEITTAVRPQAILPARYLGRPMYCAAAAGKAASPFSAVLLAAAASSVPIPGTATAAFGSQSSVDYTFYHLLVNMGVIG